MFSRGFTLMEIVVVVALVFIFSTLSFGTYKVFQFRSNLDTAVANVFSACRRAQAQAQANLGDAPWGVKLQTSGGTIFKGASWSGRDTSADENFSLTLNLQLAGASEIIFAKMTGWPLGGATNLTLTFNNDSKQININSRGIISY
jgi:prepilin-type N-terminal cleavage/methylation domain-containing protein